MTYCPTEDQEQAALMQWARTMEGRWPELADLHAIPNGGLRSKATAARLKATGVKPGVPDLHLPVARQGCHGLYIEMKRRHGGRISPDQLRWMEELTRQGHRCAVCRGWEEAKRVIEEYLKEA